MVKISLLQRNIHITFLDTTHLPKLLSSTSLSWLEHRLVHILSSSTHVSIELQILDCPHAQLEAVVLLSAASVLSAFWTKLREIGAIGRSNGSLQGKHPLGFSNWCIPLCALVILLCHIPLHFPFPGFHSCSVAESSVPQESDRKTVRRKSTCP